MRIGLRGRPLWRDLHAVTGLWVSLIALFLLLSGLPWSSNWGNYLTWARNLWSVTAGTPDWPVGATNQPAADRNAVRARPVATPTTASVMPGMGTAEMAAMSQASAQASRTDEQPVPGLRALDRIVPVVARLQVPAPVWIVPPPAGFDDWTISSQVQDRPLRVTYLVDPTSGAVTGTRTFAQENIVDRIVNIAVATHEGQLFGRLNQAILLLTAASLLLVSTSAVVMWWRRRPAGRLGAPLPTSAPQSSALLAGAIAALALLLPLFGISLLIVLTIDRATVPHLPGVRRWLGLTRHRAGSG